MEQILDQKEFITSHDEYMSQKLAFVFLNHIHSKNIEPKIAYLAATKLLDALKNAMPKESCLQ